MEAKAATALLGMAVALASCGGSSQKAAPPVRSPSAAHKPAATFSPNPSTQKDAYTLSVSGFKPGASLVLTLARPDGARERYSIAAGADGTGSRRFASNGSVLIGTHRATVTDPATGTRAKTSLDVLSPAGP